MTCQEWGSEESEFNAYIMVNIKGEYITDFAPGNLVNTLNSEIRKIS